jgi:hypothetical protein
MNDQTSICYFVRDGILPFVVELGRLPGLPTLAQQEKLLMLADMCEVEYSGARDPLMLSALTIARLAAELFVWRQNDAAVCAKLLDALRFDLELSGSVS